MKKLLSAIIGLVIAAAAAIPLAVTSFADEPAPVVASGGRQEYIAIGTPYEESVPFVQESNLSYSVDAAPKSTDKLYTRYAYNDFADKENGSLKQEAYNRMLKSCKTFETCESDLSGKTFDEIVLNDLNLSINDAVAVYFNFRHDNPQYYWLENQVYYSYYTGTNIIYSLQMNVYDEYLTYAERKRCNNVIDNAVKEYAAIAANYSTVAEKAMAVHDTLIYRNDYLFNDDRTPSDSTTSHNIIGTIDKDMQGGVCESFAKTYQLLLNYLGIDNVYVVSLDHAFSLVKLDDGKYYYVDSTWDENTKENTINQYRWFGICKSQFENDSTSHITLTPNNTGVNYLYDLPEISSTNYTVPSGSGTAGVYSYTYKGVSATVTGYSGNATVLSVPERLNGKYIRYFNGAPFSGTASNVKYLELPDTLSFLNSTSFTGFTSLRKVLLPDYLEILNSNEFKNSSPADVYVSDHTVKISNTAFSSVTNVHSKSGSAAQNWAVSNGYTFKPYTTELNAITQSPTVSATRASDSITLSWTSVPNAMGYKIFVSTNGGSWVFMGETTSTSAKLSYPSDKTAKFLVRGYNVKSHSPINGTTDVVNAYDVPAKPVVTATAGNASATLSWKAVSGAISYTVYKYENSTYTKLTSTTSTSYKATGLTNGKTYYFLVRAFNDAGGSAFTSADHVKVTLTSASVPAKPTVIAVAGNGKAVLKWNSVSGATLYAVYKYESGSYGKVATTTNTTYTVSGLTNGKAYKFLVRAFNDAGGSAFTTADLVTVTPKSSVTSVPAAPSVSLSISNGNVTLSWNAVATATSYSVYNYENGSYTKLKATSSTSYTFTPTKGKTYKLLVRAFNSAGGSAFTSSNLITITL